MINAVLTLPGKVWLVDESGRKVTDPREALGHFGHEHSCHIYDPAKGEHRLVHQPADYEKCPTLVEIRAALAQ